jgi:hypothetical protein
MKLYLFNHFEKIDMIKNLVKLVYLKYPKINWLVNSIMYYDGDNRFEIYNKYNFIGYNETHVIVCYLKPQFNQLNYNDILLDSIYDTYFLQNLKKYNDKNEIIENYKRFNGKKIISCVFSLDFNEPYYIDWSDRSGINLIKQNEDILLHMLYDGIMEKYKLENGIVYKFYSYWREFCPENEKKTINFIRFLNTKISNSAVPKYIEYFFAKIEGQIDSTSGKKGKEKILENLDCKDFFLETLEKELEKSVKCYLNIAFDDDDDDDDDE